MLLGLPVIRTFSLRTTFFRSTKQTSHAISRTAMSSSISVPRSPPSPSAPLAAHKKVKLATIDADFPEPVQQASGSSTTPITTPLAEGKKAGKKDVKSRMRRAPPIDEVLLHDILSTLGWTELPKLSESLAEAQELGPRLWPKTIPAWKKNRGKKPVKDAVETEPVDEGSNEWGFTEAEFTVVALTSHGDGVAVYPAAPEAPQWAIIIPFTLPGDVVKAKVTRHQHYHSFADPIEIISSDPSAAKFPIETTRDESLVGCKYFGTCAGCQYQYLPYAQQLALKQHVLVKAMRNFANLPADQIPEVKETIPSPKQYNYRTKITPHFELPKALQTGKKGRQALDGAKMNKQAASAAAAQDEEAANDSTTGSTAPAAFEELPDTPIGFEGKCKPGILDIEVCPIATQAIIDAMPAAREAVKKNIRSYKRGATLLLRDSLVPEKGTSGSTETKLSEGESSVVVDAEAGTMDQEEQGANDVSSSMVTPTVHIRPKRSKKNIELNLNMDVQLKSPEEHECISLHSHTVTERVGEKIFQVSRHPGYSAIPLETCQLISRPALHVYSSQPDRSFKTTPRSLSP